MTHICVGNLTIIGSDNGLSPGQRQAIIWTNVGMLLIGPFDPAVDWTLRSKLQWNCNRNSMMTSSNGSIYRVTGHLCGEFTGEFPAQRTVTRSFDVFFDLSLNKLLSKQSSGWWFEMLLRPLWCHCNDTFNDSFKKMHLKMSFAKFCPFCLGLNVLIKH